MGEGYGVGLWKEIKKERSLLSNKIVLSVRNGRRVIFWKGKWCDDNALCVYFLSLYAWVALKEAWVAEVWDSSIEEGGWNSLSMIGKWTW